MMDSITRLRIIKDRHTTMNRALTVLFGALICTVGYALWAKNVPLLDSYKMIVGSVMMVCALIFHRIPYFVYLLNKKHFGNNSNDRQLMGHNWKEYCKRIIN